MWYGSFSFDCGIWRPSAFWSAISSSEYSETWTAWMNHDDLMSPHKKDWTLHNQKVCTEEDSMKCLGMNNCNQRKKMRHEVANWMVTSQVSLMCCVSCNFLCVCMYTWISGKAGLFEAGSSSKWIVQVMLEGEYWCGVLHGWVCCCICYSSPGAMSLSVMSLIALFFLSLQPNNW